MSARRTAGACRGGGGEHGRKGREAAAGRGLRYAQALRQGVERVQAQGRMDAWRRRRVVVLHSGRRGRCRGGSCHAAHGGRQGRSRMGLHCAARLRGVVVLHRVLAARAPLWRRRGVLRRQALRASEILWRLCAHRRREMPRSAREGREGRRVLVQHGGRGVGDGAGRQNVEFAVVRHARADRRLQPQGGRAQAHGDRILG